MPSATSRIAVIGLDGATPEVIDSLIEQGGLPHIAALIERGARAPLVSTFPIATWAAWPAMMTGVYPGKHGVYHYHAREGYRERVISARDVRAATLWQAAGAQGKRTAVMGAPVTHPPLPVNGVMVAGPPMPPGLHAAPESAWWSISRVAPGYPLRADWPRMMRLRGPEAVARRLERSLDLSARAALHLWQRERWDLFICVLCELDRVQHLAAWPADDRAPDAEQRRSLLARCYHKADQVVGALLAAMGDEVTVALVSDHGFGERRGTFHLNRWLAERGYLAPRRGRGKRLRLARRSVDEALAALGLEAGGLIGALPLLLPRCGPARPSEAIDWSATQAFGATADLDGIFINLRGREPQGTVEPGAQYEHVRDALIEGLLEARAPGGDEPIIAWARRREEVFHGPYLHAAPDVVYATADNAYPESGRLDVQQVVAEARGGSHRLEGVCVIAGPAIAAAPLPSCRIVDIAPTLLHVMGLPVARDLDGQVLLQALAQDYRERPVAYRDLPTPAEGKAPPHSDREQAALEEQLRSLGYM